MPHDAGQVAGRTHLASLAVGGDEGGVGGGGRLGAVGEHALVHLECGAGLAAPVARVDDGVVRADLRGRALRPGQPDDVSWKARCSGL